MSLVVEQATRIDPATKPYRPIGAILELFRAREHEVVVEGPADTGKSRGCLEFVHAAMTKYPGARAAMIRKTRNSLTETACVTFERFVCPDGAARLWHDQEYRYGNGSRIILIGMDDPAKILSGEYDIIYIQELSELDEEDYEIITTRATGRGAVMPYARIIADMNPVQPDFWLYGREARGDVRFIQARHEDNPSITPRRLEALDKLTGYRRKRLRLGLRVAAEGMYFEEWDPAVHVVKEFAIPDHWPRWIAVDYGFAAPFCCLWFTRDPETRVVYVEGEAYQAGQRDEQQALAVAARLDPALLNLAVGDPSMFNERKEQGRASIASVYHAAGIPLVPAVNNRKQGWATVRRALAHAEGVGPRLKVMDGRAPNLVRTLPALVRDPLDPEDVADKVNGRAAEDHAADPLRYGLVAVDDSFTPEAPEPTPYAFGPDPADSPDAEVTAWLHQGKVDPFAGRDRGEA